MVYSPEGPRHDDAFGQHLVGDRDAAALEHQRQALAPRRWWRRPRMTRAMSGEITIGAERTLAVEEDAHVAEWPGLAALLLLRPRG